MVFRAKRQVNKENLYHITLCFKAAGNVLLKSVSGGVSKRQINKALLKPMSDGVSKRQLNKALLKPMSDGASKRQVKHG